MASSPPVGGTRLAIRELDDRAWEEHAQRLDVVSFFATPRWGRIMEESGLGYRRRAWLFELDGLEVLLPFAETHRFGFAFRESTPFGLYGGPLLVRADPGADLQAAARIITEHLRTDWRTGSFLATPGPHVHLPLPDVYQTHSTHVLNLDQGEEAIWKAFDKDARNQIRQAERAQVEVGIDNSEAAFKRYFAMLEESARRWGLRDPGKPWGLFAALSRNATAESVALWMAEVEHEPAAGALCVYGRGEVFYLSGAMYERHARTRPNNLIQWRVIEDATKRGFRVYNMGSSGELEGVRRFKEQFGSRPQSYPAYLITGRVWGRARSLRRLVGR